MTTNVSTTLYNSRRTLINMLAKETSLTYKETDNAEEWGLTTTSLTMPTYKPGMEEGYETAWMGEFISKCAVGGEQGGQLLQTFKQKDQPLPLKKIKSKVVEHASSKSFNGRYAGADELLARHQYNKTISHTSSTPQEEALHALDTVCRSEWQLSSDFDIEGKLSEEGREWYDKLLPLKGEYSKATTLEECTSLSNKLFKLLHEEQAEDWEQQQEQGDSGEGENQPDQTQPDSQDQSQQGSESSGEEGEGGDDAEADGYEELDEGIPCNVKLPPTSGTDIISLPTVVKAVDHSCPSDFIMSRVNKTLYTTGNISKKVRTLLKVYSQVKWKGGKVRGKINKRAIATIPTGNERVFRQKENKDVLDTTITLLMDCSGSMRDEKYWTASAAVIRLVECLQSIHIPVEVLGFTTTEWDGANIKNLIYQIKKPTTALSQDALTKTLSSNNIELKQNDDADALLYAYDSILKRKQKRRIIIVLSDGMPSHPGLCCSHYLKTVTTDIEKRGIVELYSIGILDSSVKDYYTNYIVVKDLTTLEKDLLSLLKTVIIK